MNGPREDDKDGHGEDVVMPGFRFHPTEEELVEFYLRRKVEGKRFNVELITYLDLYRYDPWELPALAAIGEKEWFFYVPRDRKYRNGDRPNRVTTSGYWKATGADRLIRTEGSRSIGLKKTLVFYSGKAPKGIRTSWIMNEYRLPQTDKDRYGIKVRTHASPSGHPAEISLCRVYKRAGVLDDHSRLFPGAVSSRLTASRWVGYDKINPGMRHQSATNFQISLVGDSPPAEIEKMHHVAARGITRQDSLAVPVLRKHAAYNSASSMAAPLSSARADEGAAVIHSSKDDVGSLTPTCTLLTSLSSTPGASVDELNGIVGFNQNYPSQPNQFFPLSSQSQVLPLMTSLPSSFTTLTTKLWDWTPTPKPIEKHRF
ncbi:hypothetical protein Taro_054570 [Colocasia esculenta]|uniref:NAC domain-containing protein n=1 Tax=Colocasia esculenta TaxID=4460 RepID=A0A843XNX0_COLES|nr:hypothetical protein [Colocasia esculenta]